MLGCRLVFVFLSVLVTSVALALPALASAQTFTVNSTANEGQKMSGVGCETAAGKCTLRGAIEAANEDATKDRIAFDQTVFDGGAGASITPNGQLPEVSAGDPVVIDGGVCVSGVGSVPCVTLNTFSGGAGLSVRAGESVVENLAINVGGSVGIRALASGAAAPGVEILDNVIRVPGSPTGTGVELTGPVGGSGNLVEGNEVDIGEGSSRGIVLRDGPNRIYGNTISGSGCCFQGVLAEEIVAPVSGNKIGGDTEASENVISGFTNSAIWLNLGKATFNEVGRNRGENGSSFIRFGSETNGGILPPTITGAVGSSVGGTAEPGATVRIFRKAKEFDGELAGFVGEVKADSGGGWQVSANLPVGSFVAATQTLNGGTSQVTAAATVAADPKPPTTGDPGGSTSPDTGTNPGGGATGGGPPIPAPPAPTAIGPKTKITFAPKARSEATIAKFRFTTTTAGAHFECRLDKAKFARCRPPKTYRNLEPGKHVFRVRAVGPTGLAGAATKRAFSVS